VAVIAFLACLVGTSILAGPFAPLFCTTKITGTCSVKVPGAKDFAPAEEGRAYPYGTTVRTGRKSSVLIEFSEGNTCRVLANALVTITEEAGDKKMKTLVLDDGGIEVQLEEEFHKHNALQVETPAGICGAIGCTFEVKVIREGDLISVSVVFTDGNGSWTSDQYKVKDLKVGPEGDPKGLNVSMSEGGDFQRIKSIAGDNDVTIRDDAGQERNIHLPEGASMKIWLKLSPDGKMLTITIVVLNAENETIDTIILTQVQTTGEEPPGEPPPDDDGTDDGQDVSTNPVLLKTGTGAT